MSIIDDLEARIIAERERLLREDEPTLNNLRHIYTGRINGYSTVLRWIRELEQAEQNQARALVVSVASKE